MPKPIELLRQSKTKELWDMGCGFISLSMEQFMSIQRRLLLEQMELLKRCELGCKVTQGVNPNTVEEFRKQVPLTTYQDYMPYLLEQREDVLPEKPLLWQRTSGRSSEYTFKWAPVTERVYQQMGPVGLAILIFATCKEKGEVVLKEHDKFLYGMAPQPYTSGTWGRKANEELIFDFLPSLDEAEKMSFEDRIQRGFEIALSDGLDLFYGLSSVLVAVGERFSQGAGHRGIFSLLSQPRVLFRLSKALLKSKLARRPLLPKDVWSVKGLVSAGTDASIYREKIKEMWGRYPLHVYGSTESIIIAIQTWNYQAMTFVPHFNFLEFIPESEHLKSRIDPSYQPATVLLDEVKPGENYEVIITNLLGGCFVRYRIGDMIQITSLRDEELDIDTPQMVFNARVDDLIDLAGFTRLTEKTIWQAIENAGLAYKDWTARKEAKGKPTLHLYLELKKNGDRSEEQVATAVHKQLQKLDSDYADLETMLGLQPLEVTLLPSGAFQEYTCKQRASGANLVHLKPPHINPSDAVIHSLVNNGI